MQLAVDVGAAEAARRLGLNPNTLRVWVSRAGRSLASPQTQEAIAVKALSIEQRKSRLASDLLDDCQRLREQMFAPCIVKKAMAAGAMREVEIVEIELEKPTFADQRQIMTTIAIGVDKVQILTGEATERIEQLTGSIAERVPEVEAEVAQVLELLPRTA